MANKFDDKHIRKVNLIQLNIADIVELMNAEYEVELEDMKHCSNCNHIFNINDLWYEDNHNCPYCNSVENIYDCYQDDIDEINVNDLQDEIGKDGIDVILKILKKEEGVNVMNKNKMNLQEATVKALYDGLKDNTEVDDVEGLVDDVLVVTDPEITTDEYNEVIERAEEIIEDTPEGEIPLDPTYLGEYLQICPICGGSFIEDHILEPGTACPICYETPESFVMVGKLQAEEEVAEDNGLVDEDEAQGEEFTPTPIEEFGEEAGEEEIEPEETPSEEVPSEEPVETEERPRGARTRRNREVASKELPQGNILAEHKIVESKSDLYDDTITDDDYKNQDRTNGRMSIDYDDDINTNKRLYFKIDKELADTINGVHIGEITATYNPDTNTVVFFNAETGEDIDTIIYRNQTPEEIEEYMTSEAGLGLKKEEGKTEKPVKVLCYRDVTEYPTRQEAINEFRSGMMSSEGSERERYTNIYLSLIHTDKDFVYDDEDDYNDYIVKHSKKEDVDSDKKDDNKELLLGAEEDDKEYTIEEIGEDKIKELASKSALTWEGAVTTDEALQKITNDLKEKTDIELPIKYYTFSGKQMNDIYGLTDKNAYKDDLHFLSIDLDNWENIDNLPMFKMKAKARWLDDIVDGNADAQKIINNK